MKIIFMYLERHRADVAGRYQLKDRYLWTRIPVFLALTIQFHRLCSVKPVVVFILRITHAMTVPRKPVQRNVKRRIGIMVTIDRREFLKVVCPIVCQYRLRHCHEAECRKKRVQFSHRSIFIIVNTNCFYMTFTPRLLPIRTITGLVVGTSKVLAPSFSTDCISF